MLSIQMKSQRLAKIWTCVLWLLTVSGRLLLIFLHLNWEAPCCQSFSGYFDFAVFYVVFFFLWLLLLHSPKWEIISANTAGLFYRET